MKHRSHLKQQNKHFKKLKSHKKNKSLKNSQKKRKKNVTPKYSSILLRTHQSYNSKVNNIKNELEEKSKHIPFYSCLNICLLGFHEDADVLSFKKEFINFLCEQNGDIIKTDSINLYDTYTIHAEKKKKRSLVIYDIPRNIYGIIDGTKCADIVLCIFKDGTIENSSFDELGYELLSLLKLQGVPSVIGVGYNTDERNKYSQKFVNRYFNSEFTQQDKIFFISSGGNNEDRFSNKCDFYKLYHEIMNMKIRNLSYREGRGYMMVNSYAYNEENDSIFLKGFVKGAGFNVKNPIHITNIGDYYIDDIYVIDVMTRKKNNSEEGMDKYEFNDFIQENQKEGTNSTFSNFFQNKNILSDSSYYFNCNNINYRFLPIQNCENRNNMNEEEDLVCIRQHIEEENYPKSDNFMMQKSNSKSDTPVTRLINPMNENTSGENALVYKFNLNESLHSRNDSNGMWDDNNDDGSNYHKNEINTSNSRSLYGTTDMEHPSTSNEKHMISNTISSNSTLVATNQKCQSNNSWAYVSKEKHEMGEDFICSYNRNETLNAMKYFIENNNTIKNEKNYSNKKTLSRGSNSDGDNEDDLDIDEEIQNDDTDGSTDGSTGDCTGGCTNDNTNGNADEDTIERDFNNSDHVYLCKNISAKERFKRYRILQSFKSSYIDVYEDLPIAYSRVYDYENYENLSKYSKKKYIENSKIIRGEFTVTDAYCLFVIKNDGKLLHLINGMKRKNLPLIISSLLPYERKVTVVNMEVERILPHPEKVQSKDVFEIVCGFRHFLSRPIFSEQIIKGIQSKGKYEKYLKHGKKYIASIFGFTTVTSAPVFIIKKIEQKEDSNPNSLSVGTLENELFLQYMGNACAMGENSNTGGLSNAYYSANNYNPNNFSGLCNSGVSNMNGESCEPFLGYTTDCRNTASVVVAYGKVVNCDCKRIIMKRISLCGEIFKIHKKKAVIRNMFHRPEDINYFKPAQLHTKLGLTGKILESLGTHGKMKCLFSNVLKQHDKVFIFLYKRVYPIWYPPTWGGNPHLGPDDKPLQCKERKISML